MSDERAQTVVATFDLVERLLPRAVLLENVAGFVKGRTSALPYIEDFIERIRLNTGVNYSLNHRVVNAADYGVPQNRKRVILVLLRDDLQWDWPAPTHDKQPVRAWDALAQVRSTEIPEPQGNWSTLLPSIPEGWNYQWLTAKGGGEELFGYRTKYWNFLLKLARDSPAWTLPASPGPSTGPFHWDNRPLSSEEMQRLQSFTDDWVFEGSYRERVKQIGNATPPLLAQTMGVSIAKALGFTRVPLISAIDLREDLPTTLAMPTPVPSRYTHMIGAKDAHAGVGLGPNPRTVPPVLN